MAKNQSTKSLKSGIGQSNHRNESNKRFEACGRQNPIKRLFFDIETSPNVVLSWNVGYKIKLDYANIVEERAIICIGYKFAGDSSVNVLSWDNERSDRALLGKFIDILASADECIGHNIDRFDLAWIKTRCLFHKLPPFPIVKTADTLKWARRQYRFNSNRLDYIADFLGIGRKIRTEFGLWKEVVLDRNREALAKMKNYCAGDVALLEKVWERLSPDAPVGIHAGRQAHNDKWSCPRCATENVGPFQRCVTAAGTVQMKMKCRDCGGYYRISDSAHRAYVEEIARQKQKKTLLDGRRSAVQR